jgi:hypothetical protein
MACVDVESLVPVAVLKCQPDDVGVGANVDGAWGGELAAVSEEGTGEDGDDDATATAGCTAWPFGRLMWLDEA